MLGPLPLLAKLDERIMLALSSSPSADDFEKTPSRAVPESDPGDPWNQKAQPEVTNWAAAPKRLCC